MFHILKKRVITCKFIFLFSQTTTQISRKVPDTTTSWIITAFSIDPITGFAMTKQHTKVSVLGKFFVSMDLPYSIKRGEIVSIPISVFNYMEDDQTVVAVAVTLFNEDLEFEFIDEEVNKQGQTNKNRTKSVLVKKGSGASSLFEIRASKIGSIKIKVAAESQSYTGDWVVRYLIVKPEGITHYGNEAVFVDLRKSEKFTTNITIPVESNVVNDSIKIEASIIGDILGLPTGNVNKLM